MSVDVGKQTAAEHAVGLVEDGMTVGLGAGSTAELFLRLLGERYASGLRFTGVPTSEETARLAKSYDIPLTTLEERGRLDIAIDGADEVDPQLNLIKGHGGALLREKIVARAAARYVIIVDDSKRVLKLGQKSPIPVEVIPFGWTTTKLRLEWLGFTCELRGGQDPYKTASRNYILDCHPPASVDLASPAVADSIKLQTGVVEHGLFLGMASLVIIGKTSGGMDLLRRPAPLA